MGGDKDIQVRDIKWRLDIRIQDAGGRSRAAERHPRDKERDRDQVRENKRKSWIQSEFS